MTTGSIVHLRDQLAGVRGLLLDLDGVLVLKNYPLPGATGALESLDAAGFPFLVATNTSMSSRATMSLELGRVGLSIPAGRIVSAASAAASYTARHLANAPLYVLVAPDAMVEFEGQRVLTHGEAAAPGARVAAVVVGDAGDEFTPRNMQTAFSLLRGGARFIAMHKNRWWITPAGVLMDSGGYVAALEFAAQRRALVTGKPSRAFFADGVRQLGAIARSGYAADHLPPDGLSPRDVSAARFSPREVAMVGDDLWNDVRGAQRAGLRGVFVRSGKHGDTELARLASERGSPAPDAVAPSIAEVVAALLR